jgi:sulfate/thiosulfate transport system permease protein
LMVEEKYQNFAQGSAYAIAFLLVMFCIACLVVVAVLRPQDER